MTYIYTETNMRKSKVDEILFILAYPLTSDKELAEYLKCSKTLLWKLAKKYKIKKICRRINQYYDLANTECGFLKIKSIIEESREGHRYWLCECKCGNKLEISSSKLRSKLTISCGCESKNKQGIKNFRYNGYKEITGSMWSHWKRGAKDRNLSFNLTKEDIWELYLKQDKKCALSGLNIFFLTKKSPDWKTNNAKVSIDRINSSKGYYLENVQLVHKQINYMKQSMSDEEFIRYCKCVATRNTK